MKTELGKIITEAREKIGISQRELARQANMDCAEISRIEAGKRIKPNVLYLKGISDALDLKLSVLMGLAGYSDLDINNSNSIPIKSSNNNIQFETYKKFYFNILNDIEERRRSAFACKGIITDIIEKLELSKIDDKEIITSDQILDDLKEALTLLKPNLKKLDKSKFPIK